MAASREKAAEAYRLYGPAIYRRCLRLLGDREGARDATQEVFMKLLRDTDRLDDRDLVLPWIYRVATNHCFNQLRNTRRRGESGEDEALLEVAASVGPELFPERHLATQVLARFDEETRAVAVGVLVDGMEHQEVARALGISTRTVSRKLDRFLENARKFVARSDA